MDELIGILEGLHPDVDFRQTAGLIDDGVLDSFDIISLVAEIDNIFDVQIPAAEIVPENFNSAQALQDLIERLSDD
ncbi:MAG: acyl carrier protein [Clostridiaceae bacterium]|jgi:acyl carrier protein|nr:acyl carrier protein [Clostridiaceae bacterium]